MSSCFPRLRNKNKYNEQLAKRSEWVLRLKETSNRNIAMASSSPTTGDYEEMKDPLHSQPDRKLSSPTPSNCTEIGPNDCCLEDEQEEEVYLVKQNYGYCSIGFSIVQTIILIIMMIECGVAPMNINPMVGPYPDALSDWGGKNAVNILDDGEWWRLVTPIFLHAGIIHLLCNIAVQLETGAFFEREWGSTNWMIIYLGSAVGSSVLSVICMPNSVSVGSSGAVMGLFGGKLAELICRACESTKTPQDRVRHSVRKEQLGGTLCAVTLVMAFSFIPYVDWSAHLGGIVSGLVVGLPIFACDIKTRSWRILWFIVGTVLTIASFAWAFTYMYSGAIDPAEELRDVCGYYQQFFEDYECHCMREEQE